MFRLAARKILKWRPQWSGKSRSARKMLMKKMLVPVILAVFMTSGCAMNQSPLAQREGLYYPMCYSPLQKARALDSRARDIAFGAGKGLLAGTLAGLAGGAVSALFTGDPLNIVSGAAIGAAGGAVAGGVAGGMDDHTAQKDALIAEWSEEVGRPLEGMSFNQAAATTSISCYNARLEELSKEVKDDIVSDSFAQPRLAEIELGRQEAYALLQGSQN